LYVREKTCNNYAESMGCHHTQLSTWSLCPPPTSPYQFVISGCKKLMEWVPERQKQENYLSTGKRNQQVIMDFFVDYLLMLPVKRLGSAHD